MDVKEFLKNATDEELWDLFYRFTLCFNEVVNDPESLITAEEEDIANAVAKLKETL